MSLVPLVKTAHAASLLQMIKQVNRDIYTLISQAGLPENILAGRYDFVPERPVQHLLELIAQHADPHIYGELLQATIRERFIPNLLGQLNRPETIRDALQQILDIVSKDAPNSRYSIDHFANNYWLCRRKVYKPGEGFLWAELAAVLLVIELISALSGNKWLPGVIALQAHSADELSVILNTSAVTLYTARSQTAICLDDELLEAKPKLVKTRPHKSSAVMPTRFIDTVYQALMPYFSYRQLTLEQAAKLLDMSPRTLQRRLAEEGTSYKQVRESIMLTLACQMMENPNNYSLTGIAEQLGYANISHFSRAFKQLTGVPPKEYRKRYLGGGG